MKILIADDHPLYREALRTQIERLFPGVQVDEVGSFGEVSNLGSEAALSYSLYLLDFHMPGMSVGGLKELTGKFPGVPIAVVSGTANGADVRAVVHAGVKGFLPKTATGTHLGHALQLLLAGGTSVPSEFLLAGDTDAPAAEGGTALRQANAPVWLGNLSLRELDVLKGVARGLSNKEVGRELGLAEVTIKLHLRSVFRKIGARSRSEAAVIATKANIA